MDTSKLPDTGEPYNANTPKPKPRRPLNRRIGFWIALLLIIVLLADYVRIHAMYSKAHPASAPPVPVVVATVKASDVPVYLTELGAVTPLATVTLKTQINGILMRVLYQEGQMVKAGDLLAEIDERPYLAQLAQYEGQLARDSALLANALIDLKRYQTLWKQDSVAKQVLDTQVSLVNQYQGAVEFDKGQIEVIKVNLIYCKITAPVDGRMGLRLIDPGNFVQTSDTTGLAVITTLNPITVIFSMAEDNIPEVMQQINAGQILTVEAYNRNQTKLLDVGRLLTIDNQVDATTGMVKLRAQFDNKQFALFPNQFVNVKLLVKTLKNSIVIPTAGVQHGAKNDFVYLLNANNTVSIKPITTDITSGDLTIVAGLTPGQVVVTEGVDKLTDGAKVTVPDPKKVALLKSKGLMTV